MLHVWRVLEAQGWEMKIPHKLDESLARWQRRVFVTRHSATRHARPFYVLLSLPACSAAGAVQSISEVVPNGVYYKR